MARGRKLSSWLGGGILLAAAAAVAWGIHHVFHRDPLVWVTSSIDSRQYQVRDSPYKQNAADTLARIHQNLMILIVYLTNNRAGMSDQQKMVVDLIVARYNPSRTQLSEGQLDHAVSTYTVNKGEAIVFCLAPREGPSQTVYDTNTLMFVAIHELAHIGCKGRDNHGPEFQMVFAFLLSQALRAGIYHHRNFAQSPVDYCNVKITSSPMLL